MEGSLVSIIITTKNSVDTLPCLLKSVKRQTYKKLEVIVVDNNSSDRTKEVAKKFTKKVFNKGPERSAQRNFGVKRSSGKFLLILDADMELTSRVVESCIKVADLEKARLLVVPERTVGKSWISKVRQFEREMYMGDSSVEVARFFDKKALLEFGGYDLSLTGTEDYDLPYRMSKKYKIERSNEYILHHEEGLTLGKLLQKKYYYASKSAEYAKKHPELVWSQGNLLLRQAYFRNWKKFIIYPLLGSSFIIIRLLEALWAVAGFISVVGLVKFAKTAIKK